MVRLIHTHTIPSSLIVSFRKDRYDSRRSSSSSLPIGDDCRSNRATPDLKGSPPQQPEASQTITKLLLFSMFAVSAQYVGNDPGSPDKLWKNCEYFTQAKNILGLL